MRKQLLLVLAGVAPLAGCYTYRPVTGVPRASAAIEAILSDSGTLRVAPTIGPNAASIRGALVAVRGDTLDITIAEVRTRSGESLFLSGTTVWLLRSDLVAFRARHFDRRKTTLAAIAGVAGAVAIIAGARFTGGGGGTDGGGGGPPAVRPTP